jgi:intracellular sulfur oxidation DsrE/DsrF family protein
MKKIFFCLSLIIFFALHLHAQTTTDSLHKDSIKTIAKDTLSEDAKDSIKEVKMEAIMSYPYIKGSKAGGVVPVPIIDDKADAQLQYKLIFNLGSNDKKKISRINNDLSEVARTINLHIAAGVPKEQIHAVVIVHGPGLQAILNNTKFIAKYKIANPNIPLIEELQNAGVRFISCGQSMVRNDLVKADFVSGIDVSLSALTAYSKYQLLGYVPE